MNQKITDPYSEREAQNYTNPIPSRECILQLLKTSGRLMRRAELVLALDIQGPEQLEALRRRLRAMERDGQIILARREGYGLPSKMNLIQGRVIGHKDGFGFVACDEGGPDLFLNAHEMQRVFHNDKVLVRASTADKRGRREASIVEILEHNTQFIVGCYTVENGAAFVVPDNKRIVQNILIPPDEQHGAKDRQIVIAEITTQPALRKQPIGRVVEILGEHMAPGMEIKIAIRSHNIPSTWPEAVEREIAHLTEHVAEKDKKDRVDLRHLPLVTIDGEDAQDFDDAVYCEVQTTWGLGRKKGWRLYVAIADVSHYVHLNSALDEEAVKRGNSVYFPGTVIPMLPEVLSNGLCSLKPGVDRLALVCEMLINKRGGLSSYKFYPAVIHSHARLTYTEVAAFLAQEAPCPQDEASLAQPLRSLEELYHALHKARALRGAIDFETVETRVIFGQDRKIEQIVPTQRNIAHQIIEECMLVANVATAKFLSKKKIPFLFRVHEEPTPDKLQSLRTFLAELGLRLSGGKKPKSADYADLLKSIKSRPDVRLIQTVMLRSLKQAIYTPDNRGHFGLAFPAYTHFTSPIRRYPDLLVHRAIHYVLDHKKLKEFYYNAMAMLKLGSHCSSTERRADEATRDVLDWLKCEFMCERVGEEFDGLITHVTGFGLFVELQDIYTEGLVHVSALKNDYYHFDPVKYRMQGERSKTIYRLGDRVRVKVLRVDLDTRQIDFDLIESDKKLPQRSKRRKRR